MASISERLNRHETQHQPGVTLEGELVKITEREWKYGYYPVLVLRDDDGAEHILSCYLTLSWLAEPVIAHRPKIGERIGVRFDEPEQANDGKAYNRGVIEFENDDDGEPDWERMKASRNRDRTTDTAPTGNATSAATAAWKAGTADTQTDDEGPF